MPSVSLARHRAALALLFAGPIALVGAQQVLGGVADAQMPEAIVDAHDFQRLPEVKSAAYMSAAVSTGQFENYVKPTPVPTVMPTPVPTVAPTSEPAPEQPAPPAVTATLVQSGIASTYGEGDGFEGNRTACGQVFHTNVIQIAHKSLPCGTMVRIEDANTGRTVDAEVTDRGPYVPGRVVDLSWAAFKELDPTGPGLLNVNVYVLDDE
jgi:rare lipoprotein A (peptidoglycan hydrolase)